MSMIEEIIIIEVLKAIRARLGNLSPNTLAQINAIAPTIIHDVVIALEAESYTIVVGYDWTE